VREASPDDQTLVSIVKLEGTRWALLVGPIHSNGRVASWRQWPFLLSSLLSLSSIWDSSQTYQNRKVSSHFVFVSYLVLNLLISIYFALNPFLFDFYLQFYPSVFSFSWFLYEVWSSFFWLFFFYFDCFFFLISSLIIWFHFIFISNLVFILSIALCFMLDHFLLIFFSLFHPSTFYWLRISSFDNGFC
jgi:hypothetical protein